MKLWWNTEDGIDGVIFQVAVGTADFVTVGALNDGYENWYDTEEVSALPDPEEGWSGAGPGHWANVVHPLPGLAGSPLVRFRILLAADTSVQYDGVAVDDIRIESLPTTPPICAVPTFPTVGATDIASSFNLQWTKNPAESPFYPSGYIVYLGTVASTFDLINGLDTHATQSASVPQLVDGQTYFWKVVPYGFAGELAVGCPLWNFTVISPRATFPYIQNFEAGSAGWAPTGARSSWNFGTPNKTVISGAASGVNSWVMGPLNGLYPQAENSSLQSPLFDFRNYSFDPQFNAKIWWESEKDYDGANLQMQFVGSSNWTIVGTVGDDLNWYTSNEVKASPGGSKLGWTGRDGFGSNGWLPVSHTLPGAGGKQFRLRINFASDNSVADDGFAIDDIEITFPDTLMPPCPTLVYPANLATNIQFPFNFQWQGDYSLPGLPKGYRLMFGESSPPPFAVDTFTATSHQFANKLKNETVYYWSVQPYGYSNTTINRDCSIWSFTTAPFVPPTTGIPTTATPTTAFATTGAQSSSVPSSAATSQQPTSVPSSAPSTQQESSDSQTSEIPTSQTRTAPSNGQNDDDSSSKSSGTSKSKVASIVAPIVIIVVVVAVIVGAILGVRYWRKRREVHKKLKEVDTELRVKDSNKM